MGESNNLSRLINGPSEVLTGHFKYFSFIRGQEGSYLLDQPFFKLGEMAALFLLKFDYIFGFFGFFTRFEPDLTHFLLNVFWIPMQ